MKVLVVGGGYKYLGEYLGYQAKASTETFTMGSNAWSVAAPLPFAVYGFASVSLNNKVIFLGRLFVIFCVYISTFNFSK